MTARARGIPLTNGDRLTRDEFERRYAAMPDCKKAELVEGVVYMPSPVSYVRHGGPHALLATWLGNYAVATPGVLSGIDATVRLDLENEPQPDLQARIEPRHGGSSRIGAEGYVEGAPELVIEVAGSSASYDLHDKLRAYRRNGVREYLVWRTDDGEVDWFALRGSEYVRLVSDGGVLRSGVFPGLWLDVGALLRGDGKALLATLAAGTATAEHAAFAARIASS